MPTTLKVPRLGLEMELHSHSSNRSEPHLWPTWQFEATLDPYPTERGQEWNLHPHWHYVEFLTHGATMGTPWFCSFWRGSSHSDSSLAKGGSRVGGSGRCIEGWTVYLSTFHHRLPNQVPELLWCYPLLYQPLRSDSFSISWQRIK